MLSHNAKIANRWISRNSGQSQTLMPSTLSSAWSLINRFLEWFGDLGLFLWQVMRAAVRRPFEGRELLRQLDEIGSKSLPLVALAGAAIGFVLALESRSSLARFGAKSMLPAALVYSIIHETGPIVTGLVVSGRVGAGIGAELGSMKVTEQIDAIEASGVNPYKFLAFTRIMACILMLPLLTLASDFCGVLFGWIADTLVDPVSFQRFIHQGFVGTSFSDFLAPTFRTGVFGLIIGMIGCFQGMRTQGGTAGVGLSATSSVVLSSLFVILADVILVKFILVFFS
jgi:phospholipid/cholesterol/gamma-HCH transport system permease protein